jgi:hypothetical protein
MVCLGVDVIWFGAACYKLMPLMRVSLESGVQKTMNKVRRLTASNIPDFSDAVPQTKVGWHVFLLLVVNNVLPPLSGIALSSMKSFLDSSIGWDAGVTFVYALHFSLFSYTQMKVNCSWLLLHWHFINTHVDAMQYSDNVIGKVAKDLPAQKKSSHAIRMKIIKCLSILSVCVSVRIAYQRFVRQ